MLVSEAVEVSLADFSSGKNWDDYFSFAGPLKVEICSGKDEFLVRMAHLEPQTRFVGIEKARPIARKLISKIERAGVPNIRVVPEPAEMVVKDCFLSKSVSVFFINFPDPWPKRRHHKRRLLNPEFIALMADRLIPGGAIQFVSDHREYTLWALKMLENSSALQNEFGPGVLSQPFENFPPTLYMKKYQREGRSFYCLRFRKK